MAYQPKAGEPVQGSPARAVLATPGNSGVSHDAGRRALPDTDWHASSRSAVEPAELWADQSAVRTVVGWLQRGVSSVPLHLYQRTSDTDRARVTGTPAADLLRTPAAGVPAARFNEQLVLDLAVHGRWAAQVIPSDDGEHVDLGHLPAHRVAIVRDPWGRPEAVVVFDTLGDPAVSLPLDRVLFDVAVQAHPRRVDRGTSALRTLEPSFAELTAAAQWRSEVLRNGARIPAVIERPADAPKWDDASWNRFRESWATYRAGGGDEGGTPVLEDGMRLVQVDAFDPEQFQTHELRTLTLEEAAILYGIPPELIGSRPGNYSNVQAHRERQNVDVLGPWITGLENAYGQGLRRAGLTGPGEYVEAQIAAKLRGAFEEQAQLLSSSVGAPWLTRNEARARQNLPALADGDDLVVPLNVLEGGLSSPRDTAPKNQTPHADPPRHVRT